MAGKQPCSCIRSTFALGFNALSKEVVLLYDFSDWVEDQVGFVYPDFYTLSITSPYGEVRDDVMVSPRTGSALDPRTFSHGWVDGVYSFSAEICGKIYTVRHLLLPTLRCTLDRALVSNTYARDRELIQNIETDYEVATALARQGSMERARKLLKIMQDKVDRLACKCSCR